MRKVFVPFLALSLLAVLAATALAATKSVKVGDNYYVRSSGVPTVTVTKGDKLKFNYSGDNSHNAVGVGIKLGSQCSRIRSSGSCTSNALNKRGTFRIYCSVHGKSDQSMRVRVK
jgi:plastocyanin